MALDRECSTDLRVEIIEEVVVRPCRPSPEEVLYLSNVDSQKILRRMVHTLLVYNADKHGCADPAKVIREALPKALEYYYSLAGRLRETHNEKLQLECTDQGVLFVEAAAHNNLSVLNDFKHSKPSFKKLYFEYHPHKNMEDMHLLVVQVTRFNCGGFVVVASFHHSIFDGRGAAEFLIALGEISRGHIKPSVEPVWCRELLKPRDPLTIEFRHEEFIDDCKSYTPDLKDEVLVQTTTVIDSHTISKLKEGLMQDCIGLECTSFEIVAALAWRARTKALEIPHDHTVKLFFAADVRRSFNPPLPKGYSGNAFFLPCAVGTVQDIVNGSLQEVVKIIQKTKRLLNDKYLRSAIDFLEINSDPVQLCLSQDNMAITDWRWLGFEKADFGWGEAASVHPQSVGVPNAFIFLPATNGNGMKVMVFMVKTDLKLFEWEMQRQMNEYVGKEVECGNKTCFN